MQAPPSYTCAPYLEGIFGFERPVFTTLSPPTPSACHSASTAHPPPSPNLLMANLTNLSHTAIPFGHQHAQPQGMQYLLLQSDLIVWLGPQHEQSWSRSGTRYSYSMGVKERIICILKLHLCVLRLGDKRKEAVASGQPKGWTSDAGWGCTYFAVVGWQTATSHQPPCRTSHQRGRPRAAPHARLVSLFLDAPVAQFRLHWIILAGKAAGRNVVWTQCSRSALKTLVNAYPCAAPACRSPQAYAVAREVFTTLHSPPALAAA
ncbi:hypothetical protein K438DRAFT_1254441 [Mycena galopus ATCC 62051]|nr:hypothetical protein K438DRAFT_1254441 [Mycena galopus ATCC 62051]